MRPELTLSWEWQSEYVWVCRAPSLPRQRSDDRATCVGQATRAWLDEREWQGTVGTRIVATGPLALVKRAVEIEARILCGGQGGAVA